MHGTCMVWPPSSLAWSPALLHTSLTCRSSPSATQAWLAIPVTKKTPWITPNCQQWTQAGLVESVVLHKANKQACIDNTTSKLDGSGKDAEWSVRKGKKKNHTSVKVQRHLCETKRVLLRPTDNTPVSHIPSAVLEMIILQTVHKLDHFQYVTNRVSPHANLITITVYTEARACKLCAINDNPVALGDHPKRIPVKIVPLIINKNSQESHSSVPRGIESRLSHVYPV